MIIIKKNEHSPHHEPNRALFFPILRSNNRPIPKKKHPAVARSMNNSGTSGSAVSQFFEKYFILIKWFKSDVRNMKNEVNEKNNF